MGVSTSSDPQARPTARRPSVASRRVGYTIAVGVNAALLYLVNVVPGWQAATFLTEDFTAVLGLLNLSLAASIVVNLVWIAADPAWLRSSGQLALSGLALAVVLQMLEVFPVDFSGWAFDGAWLVRFVLLVAAVGTALGLLVEGVRLVRSIASARPPRT